MSNVKGQMFQRGFTLIEMIVSLALFSVVITVAVGALTSLATASGKTQSTRVVIDNLNFALENIARGMRVGTAYHCGTEGNLSNPRDCESSGDTFIAFRNSQNQLVAFRLSGTRIERSTNCAQSSCSDWLGITDPNLTITEFRFFVEGAPANDSAQPKALLVVRGTAGVKEIEQTTFDVQTLISQRFIDS